MNKIRAVWREHRGAWIVSIAFAVIYSLIVFFNHYCFRTFALDLGVFTNALYDYSHFQWNDATVFKYQPENLLSDHFDLYLIIFSPLSYLLGQYTLLVVQIVSILIGSWGVYKYLLSKFNDRFLAIAGQVCFCLYFGGFSALSFDYHSNVVAAMLAPWLFYHMHKGQYVKFILLLLFMIIAKETISLWCFCIAAGLMIEYRKDKQRLMILSMAAVFSLGYFLLLVKVIMPALAHSGQYDHFKYSVLGPDINTAFKNIITHPLNTLQSLFVNHSGKPEYNWVKAEFYILSLMSGMLLLFVRPAYLIMLISPIFIKMCNDDSTKWSIDCHYSVEFASIIAIGAFTVIGSLRKQELRKALSWLVCAGAAFATFKVMDNNVFYHDYNRLRFYHSHHYNRGYDLKAVHASFNLIPPDAKVCAQSPILPHLAYRDYCYQIPFVKDADYIIGSKSEPTCYPISEQEFRTLLNDSLKSGRWKAVVNDTNITILKRISAP